MTALPKTELLSDRELLQRIERALQDFENVARAPFEYRSVGQARAALDELLARTERK